MNTVTEDEGTKPATKSKVKPIPDGMHAVTPHLICAGAADAIEFYKKAFDAVEVERVPGPEGKLLHGAIRIGDSVVMLVDEFPEWARLDRNHSRARRLPSTFMSTMPTRSSKRRCERGQKSRCRLRTLFGVIATANSRIPLAIPGRLPRTFAT